MRRRLVLACLLVAGAMALVSLNPIVGAFFAFWVVTAPAMVARLLNNEPLGDDWPDDL